MKSSRVTKDAMDVIAPWIEYPDAVTPQLSLERHF
jgi:hypothetical protein